MRLIGIVKAADHGRKQNAKTELKVPFTWEANNHELSSSQLTLDFPFQSTLEGLLLCPISSDPLSYAAELFIDATRYYGDALETRLGRVSSPKLEDLGLTRQQSSVARLRLHSRR
jgi:hypothetical protein